MCCCLNDLWTPAASSFASMKLEIRLETDFDPEVEMMAGQPAK